MTKEDRNQINHLLKIMEMADKAYWNSSSNNIISDGEYDDLYAKLKQYKNKYPHDKRIIKYFATMHHDTDNTFKRVRHPYHVISLDKVRTRKAVSHFLNKWSQNKNDLYYNDGFLIESKEDGLSFVIYFNDSRMPHKITALTRGSGVAGNDVTNEIYHFDGMNIRKIAKRIGNRHVVVRGEALISRKGFEDDNKQGTKFKNERNLVSGTVMNKDPRTVAKRHVFLSAYSLLNRDEYKKELPTELDQEKFLRNLGFEVTNNVHYFPNTKEGKNNAMHYIFDYSHQQRLAVGHDIDGMVIKPNYTVNFNKIGWNKHGPRYANAYKFIPSQALTKVKKIRYQISASGRLSPVVIFTHPVKIFGAVTSKCTGSSIGNMRKNGIYINGYITVKRMNDVIPKAYGVKELNKTVSNLKDPTADMPSDAIKKGKFYYIPKSHMKNSLPVLLNRWKKFVSKPCLNIMGLSTKVVKTMIKYKLINPYDFSSLWRINHQKFVKAPSFAEKGWSNLQQQLKEANHTPLAQVFLGLPIDNSGMSVFSPIAKRIGNMHPILKNKTKRQATEQKLLKEIPAIKGLGTATIPVIKDLFSDKIIKQLQNLAPYLDMKDNQQNVKQNTHTKISGMNFAITGSLQHPRKFYKNLIQKNGANLRGVTGKTNYLICNHPSSSSKYRKAQAKHIPIINEQQFMNLLK